MLDGQIELMRIDWEEFVSDSTQDCVEPDRDRLDRLEIGELQLVKVVPSCSLSNAPADLQSKLKSTRGISIEFERKHIVNILGYLFGER